MHGFDVSRLDTPTALRHVTLAEVTTTSEPPDALLPDTFAERLYDALAPLAQLDPVNGWALLIYCNALGQMFQLIEDLVRDTPEGPGWSTLVDLDRCPDVALGWLGQLVGVRLIPSSTADEQRARIASTDGFRRGTRDALIGAASATLTGEQTLIFRERDGDPYVLTVASYVADTPDPAATESALVAQKPGGILLHYRTMTGQDWQLVRDTSATWQDVASTYPTWGDVLAAT